MKPFPSFLLATSALLSLGSAAMAAGAPSAYSVRLLQPLPGYSGTSFGSLDQQSQGLNDFGQTVGRSQSPVLGQQLQRLGTVWDAQGHATALATPDGAYLSRGYGLNNKGEVVGTIQTGPDPLNSLRAVYWTTPDHYEFLLPDTGTYTEALRINNNDWILGFYTTSQNEDVTNRVSYIRKPDGVRLDVQPVTPGGIDFLFSLNDANLAFGTEFLPGYDFDTGVGQQRAVVWSEQSGLQYLPQSGFGDQDIAGFGSAAGIAAVTFDETSGTIIPYRYRPDGSIMALEQLASAVSSDAGYSMNDSGLQVGVTYTCGDLDLSCSLATLWDAGGHPYDLNSLAHTDFRLASAYSINSKGWIMGDAFLPDGERFAYLATPVPEPASWLMLLMGFAGAGMLLRRRRPTAAA